MNDQQIEQEIQAKGLTAPRVTPEDIEANIVSEHYFTAKDAIAGYHPAIQVLLDGLRKFAPGVLNTWDSARAKIEGKIPQSLAVMTFCVLVLRNGFTVTGESACASPENFDAELGRKNARQNAINKVRPLMGYALKERLTNGN